MFKITITKSEPGTIIFKNEVSYGMASKGVNCAMILENGEQRYFTRKDLPGITYAIKKFSVLS